MELIQSRGEYCQSHPATSIHLAEEPALIAAYGVGVPVAWALPTGYTALCNEACGTSYANMRGSRQGDRRSTYLVYGVS
jgi:hypothetical protein